MRATNDGRRPAARFGGNAAGGPNGATIAAVALPGGSDADRRAEAIACRVAAASAARTEPGLVEVVRRPDAPPRVVGFGDEGRVHPLPVTLAVSPRLGRAVAAAHPGAVAMGIDLERLGSVPAGLERLFLGPSELPLLAHHDPTSLWAVKEAAWNALGDSHGRPFSSLVLRCDADGELRSLHRAGAEVEARATIWRPWTHFTAALVWLP